jgi:hypothetical protein
MYNFAFAILYYEKNSLINKHGEFWVLIVLMIF